MHIATAHGDRLGASPLAIVDAQLVAARNGRVVYAKPDRAAYTSLTVDATCGLLFQQVTPRMIAQEQASGVLWSLPDPAVGGARAQKGPREVVTHVPHGQKSGPTHA